MRFASSILLAALPFAITAPTNFQNHALTVLERTAAPLPNIAPRADIIPLTLSSPGSALSAEQLAILAALTGKTQEFLKTQTIAQIMALIPAAVFAQPGGLGGLPGLGGFNPFNPFGNDKVKRG